VIPGWKTLAVLGALLGLSGVILAALGSHAVPGMDYPGSYRSWQAASLMHLAHAAVLLALAALYKNTGQRLLGVAAMAMMLGVALFCGSIYFQVIMGLDDTANLAPAGGLLMMFGWLLAIIGFFRS
jgi:uncharacterized membrane protein YgdD (TMEM256/DUF423 family)